MPNLKTASIAPKYPIVGKHDYWATYLLEQGKKAACTLKPMCRLLLTLWFYSCLFSAIRFEPMLLKQDDDAVSADTKFTEKKTSSKGLETQSFTTKTI